MSKDSRKRSQTSQQTSRDGDTRALMQRRDVLAALGAIGPIFVLGCSTSNAATSTGGDGGAGDGGAPDAADSGAQADTGGGGDGSSGGSAEASSEAAARDAGDAGDAGACHEIPDETGGPYPDTDGMISNATYNRKDITEGLAGTPLSLTLQVVDVANGCAPIVGARVIIWHCDANGVYSEYATSMNADQAQSDIGSATTTYLRGWQVTDASGQVTFTTIYPGWYLPRVTHIHVMVYNPSDLTTPVKTTQFAFPDATNATVYGQSSLYPKGQNSTTNATDQVFGSSDEYLVASIAGSTTGGYAATLPVGIASY